MPRIKRLVSDGSVLHIVQRGNNKQAVFRDEEDFKKFLSIIRKYIAKFKVEIYHYCLMRNHIHILMKIFEKKTLAKIMQGMLQSYHFYYKRKYGYIGYLYQGRYRSELITDDSYLSECGRYIERNPVRARMVKNPDEYKYSSCKHYISGHKDGVITENPLYESFGKTIKTRRSVYKEYVSMSRPYEQILDKQFGICV
ncbi:transposase [Candidatus Omnitrophota bacterium]